MDKLTHALTVKVSPDDVATIKAQAESRGMELSEYIRHLILLDRKELQRQYVALNAIFGASAKADKGYVSRLGTTGAEK